MVEKIIFRNILRINGTLNNHLSAHGSSVYNLNQIHKILLGFEAPDELGVVWRSDRQQTLVQKCATESFPLCMLYKR